MITYPAGTLSTARSRKKYCEVAVIGAGPYGLSAAAPLKAKGIAAVSLANRWSSGRTRCRKGCCCDLRAWRPICPTPMRAFTLEAYEAASKRPAMRAGPVGHLCGVRPVVPAPTGCRPGSENSSACRSGRTGASCSRCRMAREIRVRRCRGRGGIGPFKKKPTVFQDLSPQQAIHCYEGRDVRVLRAKELRSSAPDRVRWSRLLLLHEASAQVEVIARASLSCAGSGSIPGCIIWARFPRCCTLRTMSARWESADWLRTPSWCRMSRSAPRQIRIAPSELPGSRWLPERLVAVKISDGTQRVAGQGDRRRGHAQAR